MNTDTRIKRTKFFLYRRSNILDIFVAFLKSINDNFEFFLLLAV
jgi:hypothetical protein